MDAWVWIVIAAAVVVAAALIWMSSRRARTRRLRDDFGPEYDRAIRERGDRRDAEAHLREREERRDALDIRPLAPASRERYAQEWGDVQARFVDEPVGAVADADRLVVIVMRERGYPMDDFERQAELVSVDHPRWSRTTARAMRHSPRTSAVRRARRISARRWFTTARSSTSCSAAPAPRRCGHDRAPEHG